MESPGGLPRREALLLCPKRTSGLVSLGAIFRLRDRNPMRRRDHPLLPEVFADPLSERVTGRGPGAKLVSA